MFEQGSYQEYRSYLFDMKKNNPLIRDKFDILIEKGSCDELCDDVEFSKEEFIHLLALYNIIDYREGGAGAHDDKQTDQGYSNTPLKFIEEFLQNADDCEYTEKPEIEISLDQTKNTIEFVYNETGFTRADIISLTARDKSTKVGLTNTDYPDNGIFYLRKTGRKGTGFKSVFSIDAENVIVHIRSNGFSFRLDREIGRTVPIIESENGIAGKTCITVELINPTEPINTVFERIKKIFCIEDYYSFFRDNPVLFLRKIRAVSVKNISNISNDSFSLSVDYDNRKYDDKLFTVNPKFEIESGIRNNAGFTEFSFEHFNISVLNNEVSANKIEGFRYSKMIDVDDRYYVVSVMAPFIKDNLQKWNEGSLFTTLPVIEHKFSLPYAIDAPFELNDVRKALNYKNAEYNNTILKKIFYENGIMTEFLLKLAAIPDIRMDYYIKSGEVKIFNDDIDANLDSDRKRYIPVIDINKPLKSVPIFRKYYNQEAFVDFNSAIRIDKEFYSWPLLKSFVLMFNSNLGENLIAEEYSDINIRKIHLYEDAGFSNRINEYLDLVEELYSSTEFVDFIKNELIPYVIENVDDIDNEQLRTLKIFVFDILKNGTVCKCRESYSDQCVYLFTDAEERLSVNKYRIILYNTPFAVLISSMYDNVVNDFEKIFHDYSDNEKIKAGEAWEDIFNFIEASLEYGIDISQGKINYNKIVFSSNIDPEFNLFRESGTCDIIPDEDIVALSRYFNNDKEAVVRLIKDTGMTSKELYSDANGILKFSPSTVAALRKIDDEFADSACDLLINSFDGKEEHNINIGFEECKSFNSIILLCIFRNEYYFSRDNLKSISRSFLNSSDFLNESEPELVIRALFLSEYNEYTNVPDDYCISISIREVIEHNLVDHVRHIINSMKCDFIEIINDGCFEEIDNTEIWPLLEKAEYTRKSSEDIKFFKSINIPDEKGNRPFLADGKESNVYLNVDNSGDFKKALSKYLKRKFDSDYLKYYNLMTKNYENVRNQIISPAFAEELDMDITYKKIREKFSGYSKKDIISIISWFSNQGYADVVSGGKSNEKEINSDYIEEPWKFVYEFIQNVDDCSFSGNDIRNLKIIIDREHHSISFEYNEDGFTLEDIEAITRFNQSNKNKEDNRYKLDNSVNRDGVIILNETGRKGRGFKSVFSLPDDDIKVKIISNGYNFEFFKKLGYSIPVWFDETNENSGTILRIEALSDTTIDNIAGNLKRLFFFNEFENVFSSCPSLFLRNLERITIYDSESEYSVELTKTDEGEYSDCVESPFLDNVNGVIRRAGKYYRNVIENYSLVLRSSLYDEDVAIPVIKCSRMVTVDYKKKMNFRQKQMLYLL